MSRRAKKRREPEANESANDRLMERVSLGLTLVAVSAFAIFAGYLVGQYAITWVAAPLIGEPQPESARPEAASTPFREEARAGGKRLGDVCPSRFPTPTTAQAPASTSTPAAAAPASSPPSTAASSTAQSVSMYRVHVGRYAARRG